MRLGEGPKEFKSNATMHFSNANMSAVLQCLIAILVLAGFATRCGAEEMPEEVFRKVSKDKTRWVANAKGAKAKECFLVFDDEGAVVTNATVLGAFGRYNDGEKCFRGTTDTNGCYSIAGVSRDRMWYRISKEGYYSSSGVKSYIDTEEVPAVRNGCWQPYG